MRRILFLTILCGTLLWSGPSEGAVLLFDNRPADNSFDVLSGLPNNGLTGASSWTVFDQFLLGADSTITSVEWRNFSSTPSWSYGGTDLTFYNGLPTPTSLFASALGVAASITPNSDTNSGGFWTGNTFLVTGLSIFLPAGTYYMGIHNDTPTGTTGVYLSSTAGPDTISGGYLQHQGPLPLTGPSSGGTRNVDFRLFGDVAAQVPEPTTLLLLGTGLAAMGYRRRRKV